MHCSARAPPHRGPISTTPLNGYRGLDGRPEAASCGADPEGHGEHCRLTSEVEATRCASRCRRRAAALGVATVALAVLAAGLCSGCRAPRAGPDPARTELLSSQAEAGPTGLIRWATHPGKCLDIPHGSAHRANPVQIWDCQPDEKNMQFELPSGSMGIIRFATHPHMCLDVLGGLAQDGTPVGLWPCGENGYTRNQQFRVPRSGAIRWDSHPDMCLDVAGGATHNGNRVSLWRCLGDSPNQRFIPPSQDTSLHLNSAHGLAPSPTPGPGDWQEPSTPGPLAVTPRPAARAFCGVSSNNWDTPEYGNCESNLAYLGGLSSTGNSNIACKEYGGMSDPCGIDAKNDPNYGLDKSPVACSTTATPRVFFLWDEPGTHRLMPVPHCSLDGGGGFPSCPAWAAATWKRYVDRWEPEVQLARSRGVSFTSPRFTGGALVKEFAEFFAACPECSSRDSKYYIDVLAFNAWVLQANSMMQGNVDWIKGQALRLKALYSDRPVYLADFASLGATTADLQADVIAKSGIFNAPESGIDAVYYFAARDYGGGTRYNGLKERVAQGPHAGKTVGQVLLEQCQP